MRSSAHRLRSVVGLGPVPGQGQEDVVERGPAYAEAVHGDVGRVERRDHLEQDGRAAPTRPHADVAVVIGADLAVGEAADRL